MRNKALKLLKELTEAHGASGHEDEVRDILVRELGGCGSLSTDRMGSLMCEAASRGGPRVMLTAHMDEVGFLVQQITAEGLLKLAPLGGWWTHTLLAQRVRIRTRRGDVVGVVSSTPPHFLEEEQRKRVLPLEKLFVDIGAGSRAEAEDVWHVRVGDPVVPDARFEVLGDSDVAVGKAFDNRAGCAVMVEAFQQLASGGLPHTLLAVATVQEEVGCRGSLTAARLARPDVAIVLEGTPADDTPGAGEGQPQGALGRGPQIRIMDPSAISNPRLAHLACCVAEEKGIPHQMAVRRGGGTDAKSFHTAGLGVPSVVIGVPARYIHSHHGLLHLGDFDSTVALVTELVHRLDAEAVAELTRFLPPGAEAAGR